MVSLGAVTQRNRPECLPLQVPGWRPLATGEAVNHQVFVWLRLIGEHGGMARSIVHSARYRWRLCGTDGAADLPLNPVPVLSQDVRPSVRDTGVTW
jgi:hypothetical protein